jgi:hypothetical protein
MSVIRDVPTIVPNLAKTCGYCQEPIENPRRVDQKYHGGECSDKGRKVKTRNAAKARRTAIAHASGYPADIPADVAVKTTGTRRISLTSPLAASDDWKRRPIPTVNCGYCSEPIDNPSSTRQKYHSGECGVKGRNNNRNLKRSYPYRVSSRTGGNT